MLKKITLLSAMALALNVNASSAASLSTTPPANDAKISKFQFNQFSLMNQANSIGIYVTNQGTNKITSLDINWNDGTTDHRATVPCNIDAGSTVLVKHPVAVRYGTLVEKHLSVTIERVNGGADATPVDNVGSLKFNTVTKAAGKKVFFEKGTGTWCGACVYGIHTMDLMYNQYHSEKFVGVAVHNGDPMTVAAYDTAANFPAFPSMNVDRELKDINPMSLPPVETAYNNRKNMTVPAGIELVQTGTGNNVAIEVKATFNTNIASANYRLGLIISEDDVKGTGSQWDQSNYAAGTGDAAAGPYASLPNPVPAAQMTYKHVARALLGGYAGQTGSVPTSITNGQVASYTFNYTVPAGHNRDKMYAIGVLIDQSNGHIINVEEISIKESLSVEDAYAAIGMRIFPNPTAGAPTVSYQAKGDAPTISVIDMQGRIVYTKDYGKLTGLQNIQLPLQNISKGNYIVSIAIKGASYSQMLVVK